MSQKAAIRSTLPFRTQSLLNNFWGISLIFILLMTSIRMVEIYLVFENHPLNFDIKEILWDSFLSDIGWHLYLLGILFILFILVSLLSRKLAKISYQFVLSILVVIHTGLVFYFYKTLLPLGKDLFAYSPDDLLMTVKASGQWNIFNLIGLVILFAFLFYLFHLGTKLFRFSLTTYGVMSGLMIAGILTFSYFGLGKPHVLNETEENIITNKSRFLTEQSFDYFMYGGEYYFDFYLRSGTDDMVVQKSYTSDAYPFLHTAEYPDVLSPYFDTLQQAPDIVFIFLESFGKAYSGTDAYLGSFTPFLDSLEQHSLVWLNAISSTGRTFGLQPGVFGGFPFGEKGFLDLYQNFPYHKSFLSILRDNDYEIRYFTGADKKFDHVGNFIDYQKPVQFVDEKNYDPKYSKAPAASGNFTWGFADKELFRNGLEKLPQSYSKPQVITFQTQTSHDPYIVPERPFYQEKLKNHLEQTLKIPSSEISDYMAYEDIYMTVLYADDAVKEFITKYKERPEFQNTIFIITGDHRLPEIPMSNRLDRFHVPLMIYSPLLKGQEYFRGVSSHFEITPSLLSFLKNQAGIQLPEQKTWLGQVLDTARTFQSRIAMPLMRNKNQLIDYIHGDLFYSDGQLFKVSDNLVIDPIISPDDLTQLKGEFEDFKNKNNYMVQTRKLYPEPKNQLD